MSQHTQCPNCSQCLEVFFADDVEGPEIVSVIVCQPEPEPPATISKRLVLSGPIEDSLPDPTTCTLYADGFQVAGPHPFYVAPGAGPDFAGRMTDNLTAYYGQPVTLSYESPTSYLIEGLPAGTNMSADGTNLVTGARGYTLTVVQEGDGDSQIPIIEVQLTDSPTQGKFRLHQDANPGRSAQEFSDGLSMILSRQILVGLTDDLYTVTAADNAPLVIVPQTEYPWVDGIDYLRKPMTLSIEDA